MKPEETQRQFKKGEMGAYLSPLFLFEYVSGEIHNQSSFLVWDRLDSVVPQVHCWILQVDKTRYLWSELQVDRAFVECNSRSMGEFLHYRPGAVFLSVRTGHLFFVGPRPQKDGIQFLADWALTKSDVVECTLYQEGPEVEATNDRFDRVLKNLKEQQEADERPPPPALPSTHPGKRQEPVERDG